MSIDFLTDKKEFQLHDLKMKIRQAYLAEQYSSARNLLQQFEPIVNSQRKIDEQFVLLYRTLLYPENYNQETELRQYEKALLLTCPKYQSNYFPGVLSYEEIILLNNIAICYYCLHDSNRAISILSQLKNYYDQRVISIEEALRTQPMILYNLSKCLGLDGRYDECITVCDLGIHLATSTGRCQYLAGTLYNRGWALCHRGRYGDIDIAQQGIREAIFMADLMQDKENAATYRAFYEQNFPGSTLI